MNWSPEAEERLDLELQKHRELVRQNAEVHAQTYKATQVAPAWVVQAWEALRLAPAQPLWERIALRGGYISASGSGSVLLSILANGINSALPWVQPLAWAVLASSLVVVSFIEGRMSRRP